MGSVAGDQRCPRGLQVRKWPLGMTERHCPFLWRRLRAVTSGAGGGALGPLVLPASRLAPTCWSAFLHWSTLHGYFVSHLSFWGREAEAWELTPRAVSR